MNRKLGIFIVAAIGGAFLLVAAAKAAEGVEWKTLQSAKVSLEKGLAAAQPKGKPISGKFELEDGKLQLSVYTSSQGKFWEVIVDHGSGKVSKTEQIKEGEDLSTARAQNEGMSKAKTSLSAAVGKAVAANAGYLAVSIVPEIKEGKAVATVVLENAAGTKTVSESLD